MANDRLLIVCDKCKQFTAITKWSPTSSIEIWDRGLANLNKFFERHWECNQQTVCLDNPLGFRLAGECTLDHDLFHEDPESDYLVSPDD